MNNQIRVLEELSMNAHPAINTMFYDGWYLRFANGYTKRANSVALLNSSVLSVPDKIKYCEMQYEKQNLPTVFKMTPVSKEIDVVLAEAGYAIVDPSYVMMMEMPTIDSDGLQSMVTETITEDWQDNYIRLNGVKDTSIPMVKKIQSNIQNQLLCASITVQDEVVACGLCVVEGEFVGLYDIIVSAAHRQKGYGKDICKSLLNAAAAYGAKKAYLQVVAENTNALKLYNKLGFRNTYQYWYRVKNK